MASLAEAPVVARSAITLVPADREQDDAYEYDDEEEEEEVVEIKAN